jgi:anti-sigma factor (TIGR02949 family)
MDCTDCRSRLDAYLDQELDLPGAVAIDQHLESCASCKGVFSLQASLRGAVRRYAAYRPAPEGLAERIRARLAPAGGDARVRAAGARWRWPQFGHWLPLGAATAAAALISWTAAIQYASLSEDQVIAEQVISGHARSIVTGRLIEVASSDQHTVKPWLSGKLDFSPPVTDLAAEGFPLAGGRLDYLDGRSVAALVYGYRRHVINLFVWPDSKSGRRSPEALAKNGFNVLHWSDAGMTYWAISDVNAAELKTFAEAYASAK